MSGGHNNEETYHCLFNFICFDIVDSFISKVISIEEMGTGLENGRNVY